MVDFLCNIEIFGFYDELIIKTKSQNSIYFLNNSFILIHSFKLVISFGLPNKYFVKILQALSCKKLCIIMTSMISKQCKIYGNEYFWKNVFEVTNDQDIPETEISLLLFSFSVSWRLFLVDLNFFSTILKLSSASTNIYLCICIYIYI